MSTIPSPGAVPHLLKLSQRARAVRSRAAVRCYELRQMTHARGVWFRLRRVLVDAERVLLVSPREAEQLLREGFKAEPVGDELSPAKTIVFVPEVRAALLESARDVRPALSAELLASPSLVLVRFASGPNFDDEDRATQS